VLEDPAQMCVREFPRKARAPASEFTPLRRLSQMVGSLCPTGQTCWERQITFSEGQHDHGSVFASYMCNTFVMTSTRSALSDGLGDHACLADMWCVDIDPDSATLI
jgi:hypothetical protein